jgi:uncharacterized protein
VTDADFDTEVIAAQLGRRPRAVRSIAGRCPCGLPCVIETAPRLEDGTPFPTLYYLTCPRAVSAIGTLEAGGAMRRMTERLAADAGLRAAYQAAHRDYLERRDDAARADRLEPLPAGTQSAGGMPDRVKCLHALAAHELAVPGTNPLGRAALDAVGEWWLAGPCVVMPGDGAGDGLSPAVDEPVGGSLGFAADEAADRLGAAADEARSDDPGAAPAASGGTGPGAAS